MGSLKPEQSSWMLQPGQKAAYFTLATQGNLNRQGSKDEGLIAN